MNDEKDLNNNYDFIWDMSLDRRSTFYTGRIYLINSIYDYEKGMKDRIIDFNNKLKLFFENINTSNISENPSFEWRFGDIELSKKHIFGRLGKIRSGKTKTVFNKEKKGYLEKKILEGEAEVSHFYICLKNHLIIFEERPNIGYKEFIILFSSAFDKHLKKEKALVIELVRTKLLFDSLIQKAKKITKVHLIVRPANPNMEEDKTLIDKALKDMDADSGKLDFSSKKRGLNKENDLLKSAFYQANRGYGHFTINYENEEGLERKFTSKTKNLKDTIPVPKLLKEIKDTLLDLLKKNNEQLKKK